MGREVSRQIAIGVYRIALGQVVRLGDAAASEAAMEALRLPSPSTIRALIGAGHGTEWLPSIVDALAEVGIAAAADVLSSHDSQQRGNEGRSEPNDDAPSRDNLPQNRQQLGGLARPLP